MAIRKIDVRVGLTLVADASIVDILDGAYTIHPLYAYKGGGIWNGSNSFLSIEDVLDAQLWESSDSVILSPGVGPIERTVFLHTLEDFYSGRAERRGSVHG